MMTNEERTSTFQAKPKYALPRRVGTAPDDSDRYCWFCHMPKGEGTILTRRIDPAAGITDTTPFLAPCPECTEAGAAERAARRALKQSGLEGFDHLTFSSTPPRDYQRSYWSSARRWSERPAGCLFIHGDANLGKSVCARIVANERRIAGDLVLFWDVRRLLDAIRATYDKEQGGPTEAEVFTALSGAKLLVLDDLGQERATPWALEKLGSLLAPRWDRPDVFQTIITTNRAPDWFFGAEPEIFYRRLHARLTDRTQTTPIAFVKAKAGEKSSHGK